jgi:hypothetical protein
MEHRVLGEFTHFFEEEKKRLNFLNRQMCVQTSNETMQIKNIYRTLSPLP